jgi:hypothetical protein
MSIAEYKYITSETLYSKFRNIKNFNSVFIVYPEEVYVALHKKCIFCTIFIVQITSDANLQIRI